MNWIFVLLIISFVIALVNTALSWAAYSNASSDAAKAKKYSMAVFVMQLLLVLVPMAVAFGLNIFKGRPASPASFL